MNSDRLPVEYDSTKQNYVKRKLYEQRNTADVFWSPQHNSYVYAKDDWGFWFDEEGNRVHLISINGHGEIRWTVSSEQGNTSGDLDAARYFRLRWHTND